ncbi:MAG TPA: hypothetical protein EYP56_18370 [Planctomycetaceae bacterium]|nr:hypothetical protein [Planctomycetaceae bacterium]
MELIEQAVFTSAQTDHAAGYHLVATSPGVCGADARHLSAWGPSHGALLGTGREARSINFHRLPSGAYCVSRTTAAGWEYSGRGGQRSYTQCLILAPDTLARFANNPFAVVRAAEAAGAMKLHGRVPPRLPPFALPGRAAAVDAALLLKVGKAPGPEWMAAVVQATLLSQTVAIAGGPPSRDVIAGVINCFPPQYRSELSFSTGLRFSPRRPFRLVGLADANEERRRVRRLYDVMLLDLDGTPPAELAPIDAWPRLIHRVLKTGNIRWLANRMTAIRGEVDPEHLPALGLELLEQLEASPGTGARRFRGPVAAPPQAATSPRPGERSETSGPVRPAQTDTGDPHRLDQSGLQPHATAMAPAPVAVLEQQDPNVIAELEQLDDLVYDAIDGDAAALERLKALWPELRRQLPDALLEESREQYVRYAVSVWEQQAGQAPNRRPACALPALDILSLLTDEG